MKSFVNFDYQKALRNYYHKTKGYVNPSISHKIQAEIQTIDDYEKENVFIDKRGFIVRFCLNLIGHLIGTVTYCFLIIFALREIFQLPLEYTAMNILLISVLLLGHKMKFRLTPGEPKKLD